MGPVPPVPINPRYGQVNVALAERWAALAESEDGPFLAINRVRCRPRADYLDGRVTYLTARDADHAYTPAGTLVSVGASFVLAADVDAEPVGERGLHRLGIVS